MKSGIIDSLSVLKISGADAQTFLQGQLSNDVNLLDHTWQFSGYCNPKGRLLAMLTLWRDEDPQTNTFYALLSTDLVEQTTKRLKMYVMRSKVSIEKVEKSIYGFSAYEDLIDLRPDLAVHTKQGQSNAVYFTEPGDTDIKSSEMVLTINERCLLISDQSGLPKHDFDANWLAQNINAGIPQITVQSTELFIPQMINLDLLDGINFKKGCYTGQEIIARMHYLGNLKQRMFVCEIADGEVEGETISAAAGDKIINNLDEQKNKGTIVCASKSHNTILAVLKLDSIDQTLCLENGQKLRVANPQPYSTQAQK